MNKQRQSSFRFLNLVNFLFFLSLIACGSRTTELETEQRVMDFLNHRDYQSASIILKDLLEKDPDNSRYKLLLATAYLGSLEFNVVDSLNGFSSAISKDTSGSSRSNSDEPLTAIEDVFKETIHFFQQSEKLYQYLRSFPYTPRSQRYKILEALTLLNSIPLESKEGVQARGYFTVISAFQILNLLRDAIPGYQSGENSSGFDGVLPVCQLSLANFIRSIEEISYFLSMGIQSILEVEGHYKKWKPKKLESIYHHAEKISAFYQNNRTTINIVELAEQFQVYSLCRI